MRQRHVNASDLLTHSTGIADDLTVGNDLMEGAYLP